VFSGTFILFWTICILFVNWVQMLFSF